jgi:hypothetical protein
VSFLEYIAGIDFGGAILVAVAIVAIAIVVSQFLLVSADDLLRNLLPGAGRLIGQSAIEVAHEQPDEAWFCRTCKSLNLAGTQSCYRGCGPRPAPADPASVDRTGAG